MPASRLRIAHEFGAFRDASCSYGSLRYNIDLHRSALFPLCSACPVACCFCALSDPFTASGPSRR